MKRFGLAALLGLAGVCMHLQAKVPALDTLVQKEISSSAHRVVVSVPGMVCQMCVHGMRKVFKDSVKNAETDVQVDLGKKTVTLNLVTALSNQEIERRVVQAGYKADKIQRL